MLSLIASAALFLPAATTFGSGDDWHADYDAAVAVARAEGKDLLVDFTGSDWCGWCIKLHDEVFQYDTFLDAAKQDYVLVALDFPRDPEILAAVPNPERNQELMKKYGVQGFPTILLVDVEGNAFGQMGYAPGGPEEYVASMRKEAETGKAALARVAKLAEDFAAAQGEARTALIGEAVAFLESAAENGSTIGWDRAAAIARHALGLEGEANTELTERSIDALLSGPADAELIEQLMQMDPANESGRYERALFASMGLVSDEETASAMTEKVLAFAEKMQAKDAAKVAEMFGVVAMWNEHNLDQHETAVKLAEKALALDPDMDAGLAEALGQLVTPAEVPAGN